MSTTAAAREIAAATLTDEERTMLGYATASGLTGAEKRELLYYLDVETLPDSALARVEATVARIVGDRLNAGRDDWERRTRTVWQRTADRWNPDALDFGAAAVPR